MAYVLVIDDEASVRKIVHDNLKLSGFDVRIAAGGEEGLASLDPANLPGVVITDIIMPKKNGIEVITDLKKIHPSIKIIAMSGGGKIDEGNDLLEKARQAGADAVLSKPLDLDELEATVQKYLR